MNLFDTVELQDSKIAQQFQCTILGRPQQRGSKIASMIPKPGGGFVTKNGRPILVARDSNKNSKDWMQEVRSAANFAMASSGTKLMRGPIELTARFYFMRPKAHFGSGRNSNLLKDSAPKEHAQSPDLAKLIRCLEDSLTGVLWHDDKLVFRYGRGTQRYWTTEQERCEIEVRELVG